jgi:hypothetical protein
MTLFVIFVFGAVVLGAGVMLAPALPTQQPRIGLAAALWLALVLAGAILWALIFGWDTLIVDYVLFFLISVIFLGGTLSYGQKRAERRGEVLSDAAQGWPSARDLAFFGGVAFILMILTLTLPTPAAVAAHPPTRGEGLLDAPAFRALSAYLEQALGQTQPITQFAIAAVLALVCVWLVYDLSSEIRDKQLGRIAAALAALPLALWMLTGQYQTLLVLVFALAFVIHLWRFLRQQYPIDALLAALMLGIATLCQPIMLIPLIGVYGLALALLIRRRMLLTAG